VTDEFDTAGSGAAMLAQFEATNALVARLSDEQALLPTRLGEWRVIELVAHISSNLTFVQNVLATRAEAGTETSPLHWYRQVDEFAGYIDEGTRADAAVGWIEVHNSMPTRLAALTQLLADEDLGRVVVMINGDHMTLEAVCATRCVELVLHTLDLVAATSMECHLDAGAVDIAKLQRRSRPPRCGCRSRRGVLGTSATSCNHDETENDERAIPHGRSFPLSRVAASYGV
jgi:uncharacterized protein (TIGR03083 family)